MKIFTVKEVATILKVSPRQVTKWCDGGKMHAFRIPGTQQRKISLERLEQFIRENGGSRELLMEANGVTEQDIAETALTWENLR